MTLEPISFSICICNDDGHEKSASHWEAQLSCHFNGATIKQNAQCVVMQQVVYSKYICNAYNTYCTKL
jgi:hypothetical protein